MDIYCVKCGEPWDMDSLHDNDRSEPFTVALRAFQTVGCKAIYSDATCRARRVDPMIEAMYELLGDDVDGAAAMFEDLRMLSDETPGFYAGYGGADF